MNPVIKRLRNIAWTTTSRLVVILGLSLLIAGVSYGYHLNKNNDSGEIADSEADSQTVGINNRGSSTDLVSEDKDGKEPSSEQKDEDDKKPAPKPTNTTGGG